VKTPIYSGIFQSDLDATGYRISGLPAPSAGNDAATKAYVDAHAGGGGGGGLPEGWVSVMDYGAAADGVTDDTAAAVAAVAAATSVVYFPPGNYFFAGSIGVVPANISLMGGPFLGPHGNVNTTSTWYLPNNNLSPTAGGTCFLLTANAGNGAGTRFISLSDNSSVTGITFYWPNQLKTAVTPTAYPWAIYLGTGAASSVKYCNFVNGYQCIYIENTMFSLVEEVRGQALFRGIKCEGNFDVTRLRGVHFNASWDTNGNAGTYTATNAIAFDFGRNDLIIAEECFAFLHKCWIHFYNDPTHNVPGPPPILGTWGQIRGGGGDQCAICVWVEQVQAQGIDIDGVHLATSSGIAAAPNICVQIDSTNSGSVRIHNSMMYNSLGTFGTVAGSGEVMVDGTYCFGSSLSGGTATTTFGTTGWAVTGTGNFTMRDCTFRTTQTHVSLAATLTKAIVTGNLCTDTFVVTNNMAAGSAVIDANTGSNTVYVGSDFRLVAVAGGAKIQARNTGTNTWADMDQWTNP